MLGIVRADRLLSLLLLLQHRGRRSAKELADELEVSTRTVLRDIEALSTAGVPVYAERGRHGGFALLPGYSTDLTGLTHDEALALLVAGSRGDGAGMAPALASAMRKVVAGLPAAQRESAGRDAGRILVRDGRWLPHATPAAGDGGSRDGDRRRGRSVVGDGGAGDGPASGGEGRGGPPAGGGGVRGGDGGTPLAGDGGAGDGDRRGGTLSAGHSGAGDGEGIGGAGDGDGRGGSSEGGGVRGGDGRSGGGDRRRGKPVAGDGRVVGGDRRSGKPVAGDDAVLATVRAAVFAGRRLDLRYAARDEEPRWRAVDPVGLVSQGGRWYLLALRDGHERTYRLSRVREVRERAEQAVRPPDVDLDEAWRARRAAFLASLPTLPVEVRVRASRRADLLRTTGEVLAEEPAADGWLRLTVAFGDAVHAERVLWSMAADVEVLAPAELRALLAARAETVAARYRS
jgi:predicted DNA-binding transcriptional regulator YafY